MNKGNKDIMLTPLIPKNNTMNLQSRNADVSTIRALMKMTENNNSDIASVDQPLSSEMVIDVKVSSDIFDHLPTTNILNPLL